MAIAENEDVGEDRSTAESATLSQSASPPVEDTPLRPPEQRISTSEPRQEVGCDGKASLSSPDGVDNCPTSLPSRKTFIRENTSALDRNLTVGQRMVWVLSCCNFSCAGDEGNGCHCYCCGSKCMSDAICPMIICSCCCCFLNSWAYHIRMCCGGRGEPSDSEETREDPSKNWRCC